jgi:hypothetical protein
MVRELGVSITVLTTLSLTTGCSLILDFSGSTERPIDAAHSEVECMFKEPNDTRDTATTLELTDVGPAAICSTSGDDADFYRVTIPANSMVSFRISYFFSSNSDLDLQLTDLGGAILSSSRGFDNDEIIVCPGSSPPCAALAPGDYVLHVFPGQPGMQNRYDIAIAVQP